ncbi:hypothetical protein K7432_012636 [Basidiobolus ranarum]|uniref:Uncharacterized protein n=1 Tax=Basidiobolus ranarum TaxID=34480 RepID=A0ABR2WKL7_9FUNG
MVGVKLLTSISLLATSTMAWVWPMPQQMDVGSGILRLDKRLRIDFETPCDSDETYYGNYVTHCEDYDILRNAVRRYRKLIFNKGEFGNQLDTVSELVFPIPVTSVPSLPAQPRVLHT